MSTVEVFAPCPGRILAMADIPDPVFSTAMVGQGVGIEPRPGRATVMSPIVGKVAKVHPHAFIVVGSDGTGVLVHLGINTSRLKGEGFEVHAQQGDQVEVGTPMVTWDPGEIRGEDISVVVPVVVMDVKDATVEAQEGSEAVAGERLFTLRR